MVIKDDETEEPSDEVPEGQKDGTGQSKGRRASFQKLPQDITPEDLASAGYHKMVIVELNRLDDVEVEFKSVTKEYHEANTSLSVMNERLKTHNAFEVISTGSIAIGSALFGAAFSFKEDTSTFFWILVILSLMLVLVGAIAKVMRS